MRISPVCGRSAADAAVNGVRREKRQKTEEPSVFQSVQAGSWSRGRATMSRRKQSKPRQIKRSLGDLDGGEENTPDNLSLSGEEGGASDPDDSAEGDSSSPPLYTPLFNEEPRTQDSRGSPDDEDGDGEEQVSTHSGGEEEEAVAEEEEVSHWRGPDELELCEEGGDSSVVASRDIQPDITWGPYPGIVQSDSSTEGQETEDLRMTLVCDDPDCWIRLLPLSSDPSDANCTIYSRGEELFCRVTRELVVGEKLLVSLSTPPLGSSSSPLGQLSPPLSLVTQKQPVVKEEPLYPAALRSEIQLLPQQAGMAAILATAVVNKDIFPCKDCGIWYRSERNLQAHLMYYCASRQKQPAAASSPPQDKPKESYPNERICPFPQCNKSCPSASSLEIHMRTHSGERPFVCLICLSAFTTKANCERHLKVHTDTLNGVCHGCGFISTTRDILYSHLVTSHMVCQPGSRSEVYSPGPGLPKLPLSTGLSPGDSGVVLKCQVCGHNSDTPAQLQQHVRTHLEVRVPAERSPTPRQSTPTAVDHSQLSSQERGEPLACVPKPDSSSPGANGGSATPRDYGSSDPQITELKIKEEPHSDSETEEQQIEIKEDGGEAEVDEEEGDHDTGCKTMEARTDASSCQNSNSPNSPAIAAVKAEPTSPTPGSSPVHVGGAGSVVPGGAFILPQYMFNPEAAILPQASEILAKMSEMVHSRLKQGQTVPQNSPAAFFASGATAATATATPPHKGATCFECDITFNNINNFYAHKRLYCSSRHHGEGPASASAPGSARDATSATVPSSGAHDSSESPQAGAASRAASASPTDSDPPAGSGATEARRVIEVKTETSVGREGISSSSEGEGGGGSVGGGGGGGRASEGSQSPASGSAEDLEDDPNKTFCQACNIRFSRHDNYTVHKRFYCASRHDPTNHRAVHMSKANNATNFLPQPIRTRKRKKMYEIHMARTEALANAAAAAAAANAAASAPSPSILGLAVKQEVSPGGAGSSSPEGDGPIDLSKRPRLREAPGHGSSGILPALPLTDYHKCTACSISFNSIENYLAHKTYYCPATTLQPHTMEQLHRLKRSASTSPKSRPQQERPDHQHPVEAKAHPAEWVAQAQGTSSSPNPSALPASETTSPPHTTTTLAATPGAGAKVVGVSSAQVVCPYCPNRLITSDLMEHFKTTHGLVVSIQPPQEILPQPGSVISHSPSLSPRDGAAATTSTTPSSQPRLVSRVHRDSINGQARSGTTSPVSPMVNGSPLVGGGSPTAGSPLPTSPHRAPSLTVSPVPEILRETVGSSHLPDKATQAVAPQPTPIPGPKTSVISPVQNGNTRFCRLCNIKFSSLSTFIAHKKYYCSSHSAEHVK
ncbi:zinc finger protein ZFPM1 isoform X2 [Notolabrus celidotus]|uniref:zinc finger protein ZFPM1 isoform X2 n=1 Tax=Notolabrus celidotus TaxID=1203425 RepID=UPI0014905B49|nr:zinc finger protein ZFPM1 isoform X2 [Notolabrus celidotus]